VSERSKKSVVIYKNMILDLGQKNFIIRELIIIIAISKNNDREKKEKIDNYEQPFWSLTH